MKIQKYRIKKGATVTQDFSFFTWPDEKKNLNTIFILDDKFSINEEHRVKLIADGYGVLKNNIYHLDGKYGTGALYVSSNEIIPVDEKKEKMIVDLKRIYNPKEFKEAYRKQNKEWHEKEWKEYNKTIETKERTRIIKIITHMLVKEISACHTEGSPSSRLTSLANKILELK